MIIGTPEKDSDNAYTLLRLLEMYCQTQDLWELHYDALFEGNLTKKEEGESSDKLLEEVTAPYLKKLALTPFSFAEIMDIIPGNFKTTGDDREEILRTLQIHVSENYDMEIPF